MAPCGVRFKTQKAEHLSISDRRGYTVKDRGQATQARSEELGKHIPVSAGL